MRRMRKIVTSFACSACATSGVRVKRNNAFCWNRSRLWRLVHPRFEKNEWRLASLKVFGTVVGGVGEHTQHLVVRLGAMSVTRHVVGYVVNTYATSQQSSGICCCGDLCRIRLHRCSSYFFALSPIRVAPGSV